MINILETTKKIRETFEASELCRSQAEQVKNLVDKLERKDVTISVIGQFKRGKTTMINTMLGKKLLPTGIVPITAAITRIEYAEGESGETARVYFTNGLSEEVPVSELHKYISEQENHDNERGVDEVELMTEAEFLKDGLILVDTPGVGSVHENNSKSAYDFARESDGVIFMLSVDSPVNQIEVEFLQSVRKFAGKFYFVVNKIDTVDEDDLAEYMEYCTVLLSDIVGCDDKIATAVPRESAYDMREGGKAISYNEVEELALRLIPISAKKGIGIDVLMDTVRDDLLNKASDIMRQSVSRKLLEIIKNTRQQVGSYREVLRMAPNVFNRRFKEMNDMLCERRELARLLPDVEESGKAKKYLRAKLNDEKAYLTIRVRELFGIEYYYYVDRGEAADLLSHDEYVSELGEIYDELQATLNSVFMYKEEDVYMVARRIEDLNILLHSLDKFKREIEREM